MSTVLLRQRLEAEAASLRSLIGKASSDDILGRFSLKSRLAEIERDLQSVATQRATRAELALIFNGKPVVGSAAVEASFGSRAIDQFQRAVATAFAMQASNGQVGQRGPTISSEMAALHITGVVHGSFGFVLEELDPQGDQWTTSALKVATDAAVDVLEQLSSPDQSVADVALDEMSDRLLINLRDFIKLVYDNQATVTISEAERIVELDEVAVSRAYDRTADADIIDEEIEMVGILQGVLPEASRFEFDSDGRMIRGRISKDVGQVYLRSLQSHPLVGHKVKATFRKRTVRGTIAAARESFVLMKIVPDTGSPSHFL